MKISKNNKTILNTQTNTKLVDRDSWSEIYEIAQNAQTEPTTNLSYWSKLISQDAVIVDLSPEAQKLTFTHDYPIIDENIQAYTETLDLVMKTRY